VLRDDPDWRACRAPGNPYVVKNHDVITCSAHSQRPRRQRGDVWVWVRAPRGCGHFRQKISGEEYERCFWANVERREPGSAERRAHEAPIYAADRARRAHDEAVLDVAWHRLVRDAEPKRRDELLAAHRAICANFDAWCVWQEVRRACMTKPDVWLKRFQLHAVKDQETHTPFSEPIYTRGKPVVRFERKPGARAETLDCAVYATAARAMLTLDFDRREAELRAPVPRVRPSGVAHSNWAETPRPW